MSVSLVTGHAGIEHVTSGQVGAFNAGINGKGNYILKIGDKCALTILDANTIRIGSGELLCQGRHINIDEYEDITVTGATLGQTTYGVIYFHYEMSETGIESVEALYKADVTEGNYGLQETSILDGANVSDIPFALVTMNGYSIEETKILLSELVSVEALQQVSRSFENQVTGQTAKTIEMTNGFAIELGNIDEKSITFNPGTNECEINTFLNFNSSNSNAIMHNCLWDMSNGYSIGQQYFVGNSRIKFQILRAGQVVSEVPEYFFANYTAIGFVQE